MWCKLDTIPKEMEEFRVLETLHLKIKPSVWGSPLSIMF
jgi:hypothetical protein